MNRKPLPFDSPIFTKSAFARLLYQGVSVGLLTLAAFQIGYKTTGDTMDSTDNVICSSGFFTAMPCF